MKEEKEQRTINESIRDVERALGQHGDLVNLLVNAMGIERARHYISVAETLHRHQFSPELIAVGLLHGINDIPTKKRGHLGERIDPTEWKMIQKYGQLPKFTGSHEIDPNKMHEFLEAAGSADIGLLWLRAADRLDRLRSTEVSKKDREDAARATLKYYAPILRNANHYEFADEMENTAFKALYPDLYERMRKVIEQRTGKTDMDGLRKKLEDIALGVHVVPKVSVRKKSVASTFLKMFPNANLSKLTSSKYPNSKILRRISGISDLIAARIVTPDGGDERGPFYNSVLYAISSNFGKRFIFEDDYIARPKANGYQSIHAELIDMNNPKTKVNLQIRDETMNSFAEYGGAAHSEYKIGQGRGTRPIISEGHKSIIRAYGQYLKSAPPASASQTGFRKFISKSNPVGKGKLLVESSGWHIFPEFQQSGKRKLKPTVTDLMAKAHPHQGDLVSAIFRLKPDGTEIEVSPDHTLQHGSAYRFEFGGRLDPRKLRDYAALPETRKWLREKIAAHTKARE
ncbi:MAG: HD domain-containing protein [Candidatus Micrarchaeota archaeon]